MALKTKIYTTIACLLIFVICFHFYLNFTTGVAEKLKNFESFHSVFRGRYDVESVKSSRDEFSHFEERRRAYEYCNFPEDTFSGAEGKTVDGYYLICVHVFIRHGDRAPITPLSSVGSLQHACEFNASDSPDERLASDFKRSMEWLRTLADTPQTHLRKFGTIPQGKTCYSAQLTGLGSIQHLMIGHRLREAYLGKKGSFGAFSNASDFALSAADLHVRVTEYSRTFQSALAFMYGFLPDFRGLLSKSQSLLMLRMTPRVDFCHGNLAGVKCWCPRLEQLRKNEGRTRADDKRRRELAEEKQEDCSAGDSHCRKAIMKEVARILNLTQTALPWMSVIMESIMTGVCHRKSLLCPRSVEKRAKGQRLEEDGGNCFSWSLVNQIWRIIDEDITARVTSEIGVRVERLTAYPLLREVFARMTNFTGTVSASPKFVLYSGHDKTLVPLLVTLGVFDFKWPPFASRLVIELYKSTDVMRTKGEQYVRFLYNGKDVTDKVTFCQPKSRLNNGLCAMKYFHEFMSKNYFPSNRNYQQECSV